MQIIFLVWMIYVVCDLRGGLALPVYSSEHGLQRVREIYPYAIADRPRMGIPGILSGENAGLSGDSRWSRRVGVPSSWPHGSIGIGFY